MTPKLSTTAPEAVAEIIVVSPEMTAVIGAGPLGDAPVPADPVTLTFEFGPQPSLRLGAATRPPVGCRLVFLVAREAVLRIGGARLLDAERQAFHLPGALRGIAVALRDAPVSAEARSTYRLAKSIELLCEAIRLFDAGELAPLSREGGLSPADTRRVMAARRMIEERWTEKLTLDGIARACGLNRTKLAKGFRELFDCTVAEALAEQRLALAGRLLLTTDLPVSLVGYEAGYLNNASFARAFGRHFGRSPSDYRALGMAA
ncbi:AraC family transcriptional regulator [Caulobacter sp. 17J65-9]|uniref:helix-turn-helix domain-containing protein n=1 Tax=Caulobacter sp. 17J65-9 TaxID=2709382 RepID=UPI0013C56019|nr:AraC family transcriptional regulator [Caulobacter sp. 17J65-9]NEX93444.1 helix-turn-helix transcriptional regulator [Caulobacter sp. 17J65-9]